MDFEILAEQPLTLWELAGRVHGAVVHLPIGAIIVLMALEVLNVLGVRTDTRVILGITLSSFIPAGITGFLRSMELESVALIEASVHRNLMLLAFALVSSGAWMRWKTRAYGTYVAVLFIALVVLANGGHAGAELIHGKEYFTTK